GSATGAALTLTTNDAEPELPAASAALQTTVVEPTGKRVWLGGAQVTATWPSTASAAVATYDTLRGRSESTTMSAGTVITGATVSRTVTVKDADALFPCASVALHCTAVVAIGNVAPLAGVQLTATATSTRSRADAL